MPIPLYPWTSVYIHKVCNIKISKLKVLLSKLTTKPLLPMRDALCYGRDMHSEVADL